MRAFICDHCREMIKSEDKKCSHMSFTFGQEGVLTEGKYGNKATTVCLCGECTKELVDWMGGIFCNYFPDIERIVTPVDKKLGE